MSLSSQTYYAEHIELILIFGLVGFLLNTIAARKNFYALRKSPSSIPIRISFLQPGFAFAVYLLNSGILAPFLILGLPSADRAIFAPWVQFGVLTSSVFIISGFCKLSLKGDLSRILKDDSPSSLLQDVCIGIGTWILAFPVVAAVEQTADILVYALFGTQTYEQVAVLYLKQALRSPLQLTGALLMILGAAPLIEELLFRGLLQTAIKKHLGVKASIVLASLCFALFHVSASQGAGNLSLVLSLFVFSCFLGFIYERQKSLLSSIMLHITFNLVSAVRIIFTIDSL